MVDLYQNVCQKTFKNLEFEKVLLTKRKTMKTISIFLFFAMLLTVVSCADVASNEKAVNASANGLARSKNLDTEQTLNETAETKDDSTAKPNAESSKGDKVSPDVLVEDLYKQHDNENSPFFQDKNRKLVDRFFAKSLADMIWKDSVESKGDVGALDFDPLFNAQDTEIAEFKVGKPEITGEKATVEVTFLNFGEQQKIKYMLTKENEVWKIEDINYGEFTLVKLFKENLK